MKSEEKIKIGDYVIISNPLPQYKGLYTLKGTIGKVIDISFEYYNVKFSDNEEYHFYGTEIEKVNKEEYLVEVL